MDLIDSEKNNCNSEMMVSANIDMTFPRMPHDDITVALRYCASSKSIPSDAFNVLWLWGSVNGEKKDTFNNLTGLPYGFSYNIKKANDKCFLKRKIEKDISFYRHLSKNDYDYGNYCYFDTGNDLIDDDNFVNYMKYQQRNHSYENFVDYYDDEKFEEIQMAENYESDSYYGETDRESSLYGSYISHDPYREGRRYSDNELDYMNEEPILLIDYDVDTDETDIDY